MLEIAGDIWAFHNQGYWVAVTTNGSLKKDGTAVMGKGTALQAVQRWPDLPRMLGRRLTAGGNHTILWPSMGLITYPTKYRWWEGSSLDLIKHSAEEMVMLVEARRLVQEVPMPIYMPRLGCGYGGLLWSQVQPAIADILPDWVVVTYQV